MKQMNKTKKIKKIAKEAREWLDYTNQLNECAYSDSMIENIIGDATELAKETRNEWVIAKKLDKPIDKKKEYLLIASDLSGIEVSRYETPEAARKAMKTAWTEVNADCEEDDVSWLNDTDACAYDGSGFTYWQIEEVFA